MNVHAQLAALLRSDSGLIAAAVAAEPTADGTLGAAVAAGPRAAGNEAEYALLVEAIFEGYLQHYGNGRVIRPDDPDLALLAGDRLYALGIERLAKLGDLEAVIELADVISLTAQAHAEGDADRAEAAWAAGAAAVARGGGPELEAAKAAARAGAADAAGALRAATRAR
jgi:hypothetical protein